MYTPSEVYTGLKDLVGWRQDPSGDVVVSAANIVSNSGMDYQDFSALVTIANYHQTQNFNAITDDQFNTLLINNERAVINKVMRKVFSDKDIIENKVLFPFEADWLAANALTNDTSFVGYEIDVYKRADLSFILNSIFTSFDAIDTVKILLFHSSQNALIDSETITTVANSDVKTALNWVMSSLKYGGGRYYIGYLRSGLTASAINRNFDLANVQNCYNIAGIRPIKVADWDAETMFDVNNIEYTDEYYGLNFDFSGVKDYTTFIIQNKEKFINAIGLQNAQIVLDTIVNTSRSDFTERNIRDHAQLELEGNFTNKDIIQKPGIHRKLSKEIKSLRENLIDLPLIEVGTLS